MAPGDSAAAAALAAGKSWALLRQSSGPRVEFCKPISTSLPSLPCSTDKMPCQGRKTLQFAEGTSPTFERVREVHRRRGAAEAAEYAARQVALEKRMTINSFNAKEQQSQLQLQAAQARDQKRARALEVEDRKVMVDAIAQETWETKVMDKLHKVLHANERAEDFTEEKRQKALAAIESWETGVERAQRLQTTQHAQALKKARRRSADIACRLQRVADERRSLLDTQTKKNDSLKRNIQRSLAAQLEEQRHQESVELAKALDAKLEEAAARRKKNTYGTPYGFAEKAFGPRASEFDARAHSVYVDRRSPTWHRGVSMALSG